MNKQSTIPSSVGEAGKPGVSARDGTFPSRGKRLPMPHERDESSGDPQAGTGPDREKVHLAGQDLAEGQVDTDMRATPGLDSQRRESLVPGEAGRSVQGRNTKATRGG